MINQNEWIRFGTGVEIKTDLIDELINNFLQGDFVTFVHERTNSGTFELSEIFLKIKELLGRGALERIYGPGDSI